MMQLNRANLSQLPQAPLGRAPATERVLQFGEGGFLRAFADWMLDIANEKLGLDAGVVVVQPIAQGLLAALAAQDHLYTVLLRGVQEGKTRCESRIVQSLTRGIDPYVDFAAYLAAARQPALRFLLSNTTEAGIVYTGEDRIEDAPQASFPGKLTRFLYERYQAFDGAPDKGFVLLPCELIDRNGDTLLACVQKTAEQWGLGAGFARWIRESNWFCNTLVDRIVTGFPRQEAPALWQGLGYRDDLLDVAEPFGLWVIEAPAFVAEELPLDRAGLPVIFTEDATPYKLRKVRMLNGAHTAMVLGAFLAGKNTVGECMADPVIRRFLEHVLYAEIMPTLDLPQAELQAFAASVLERFQNPFNQHYLLSIALNCVSKFRARVLPTIQAYVARRGVLPPALTYALAALIAFYSGHLSEQGQMVGQRGGEAYPIVDDQAVLDFFVCHEHDGIVPRVRAVLGNVAFWGEDLRRIPDFEAAVADQLGRIQSLGALGAMEELG